MWQGSVGYCRSLRVCMTRDQLCSVLWQVVPMFSSGFFALCASAVRVGHMFSSAWSEAFHSGYVYCLCTSWYGL
jgi:hypothetical protein